MTKNGPKSGNSNQAIIEIKILRKLNSIRESEGYIIKLNDYFVFRAHLVMVFPLLSLTLLDLLKVTKYKGFSFQIIRRFAKQLLLSQEIFDTAKIIHCDLKPENILIESEQNPYDIYIIDLGSSCKYNKTVYTYIQSRFYRAPEVLIGMTYTYKIDIWSLGCIIAELYLGLPIFPGLCEYDQLRRQIKLLG